MLKKVASAERRGLFSHGERHLHADRKKTRHTVQNRETGSAVPGRINVGSESGERPCAQVWRRDSVNCQLLAGPAVGERESEEPRQKSRFASSEAASEEGRAKRKGER